MANYGYGGGFGSTPPVVKNLLIINGLVFLAQFVFEQQGIRIEEWTALWAVGTGYFKGWQLITYQFLHGGFSHILFNMLALWTFGSTLENFWGSKRFLFFYIVCGILAGVVQLLFQTEGYAVGASGAIMGLAAAFAYLFPNTELFIMFIPIPIKAKYVIPGFVLLDLFGGFSSTSDGVAHWAHLGGALAGLIIVIFWNKNNRKNFY